MSSENKLNNYLLWSRRVLYHHSYPWLAFTRSSLLICQLCQRLWRSAVPVCEDNLCQCRRRHGLPHPQSHCLSDWSTGINALPSLKKGCCAGMLGTLTCSPTGDRSASYWILFLFSRTDYSNDCSSLHTLWKVIEKLKKKISQHDAVSDVFFLTIGLSTGCNEAF